MRRVNALGGNNLVACAQSFATGVTICTCAPPPPSTWSDGQTTDGRTDEVRRLKIDLIVGGSVFRRFVRSFVRGHGPECVFLCCSILGSQFELLSSAYAQRTEITPL